jgi:Recombination directionality factor-like
MPINIIETQRRLHEAGRIRIGQKVEFQKDGKTKTRPSKLEVFRFTSPNERLLRTVGELYGGEVKPWTDAPAGKQWEVISEASAIPVLVPPSEFAFSQWFELWSGGGCKKRCDGEYDVVNERGCSCSEDPEERECKPHTRLSLLLLDLESVGIWRLDTQGWYAAVELAGAIEIVKMAAERHRMLPARLMVERRQVRKPGKPSLDFCVPVLDLEVPIATLTGGMVDRPALTPIPQPVALPTASVADQVNAVNTPPERPRRANSAEPMRRTGIKPRTAAEARGEEEEAPQGGTEGEVLYPSPQATANDSGAAVPPADDEPPAAWDTNDSVAERNHMPTKWRNDMSRRLARLHVTARDDVALVLDFATNRTKVLTGVRPDEAESVEEAIASLESGELVIEAGVITTKRRAS